MATALPTEFDQNKVYLLKGSTLNEILKAIATRTPKAGAPLTATQDTDGICISAEEFKMKICVENESEELEERSAMVLGQVIDGSGPAA